MSLGTDTNLSALMNNASHGSVGWMQQTLRFTASAGSEVLTFLAIGTPNGLPPFVLLDGVSIADVPVSTPEPGTNIMIALGLLGVPVARRLMKKRS